METSLAPTTTSNLLQLAAGDESAKCGKVNFEIPHDILNDVIYCQKTMRNHIKIHQMIATTLIILNKEDDDRIQMLETEIMQIGAEQKLVLNRLRLAMEKHFIELEKLNVPFDRSEVNAHVAAKLSANNQLIANNARPLNVTERFTYKQLMQKYGINRSLSELNNVLPPTTASQAIEGETLSNADTTANNAQRFPIEMSLPNQTILKHQISLLKPRSERVLVATTEAAPQKFQSAAATSHQQQQQQQQGLSKVINWKTPMNVLLLKKCPPPSSSSSSHPQPTTAAVVLQPTTMPMKPTPAMNSSRMNLLQALNKAKSQSLLPAAPNPIAVVIAPPPPSPIVRPSAPPPPPPPPQPPSVSKLPKKRSRSASPITSDEASTSTSSGAEVSVTSATSQNRRKSKVKLAKNKTKASSSGSISASMTAAAAAAASRLRRFQRTKSPSPTSSSGGSLDAPDLPDEDEEPTTLGKEAFLRVFGLCTLTYHAFLSSRRSERKRRNVTSTEKGDFHYGKIQTILEPFKATTTKSSNTNIKRMLLNSPPAKVPKRKRRSAAAGDDELQQQVQQVPPAAPPPMCKKSAKSSAASGSRSSSSASSLSSSANELAGKLCIACLTTGKEKLTECESCNGYYHVSCHQKSSSSATNANAKEMLCPDCLRQPHSRKTHSHHPTTVAMNSSIKN